MESLESRIGRLTPEQQKEVEDFVDFLLLKNTIRQTPAIAPPPPVMFTTPPVLSAELSPAVQPHAAQARDQVARDEQPPDMISDADPLHEIMVGDGDWITRDYMDYGKFDPQQHPATEAEKKVKLKIITRKEKESGSHLLDWVD